MKTVHYVTLTVFLLLIFYFWISKDSTIRIAGRVTGLSICYSDNRDIITTIPDTLSSIRYSYNDSTETLELIHLNTSFNYCPEKVYISVYQYRGVINIRECEKRGSCRCRCLYDMKMELYNLKKKKFKIKFDERGLSKEELAFDVDLAKVKKDTIYVVRKGYPWGDGDMYKITKKGKQTATY